MGRIYDINSPVLQEETKGRIYKKGGGTETFTPTIDWESLPIGQKIWNVAKEIPKTLYNFVPPSIRETIEKEDTGIGDFIQAGVKGVAEFGLIIPEVTKEAVAGGILQAKPGQKEYKIPGFKKAGEAISQKLGAPYIGEQIEQLGNLSSWGIQKKRLEDQGFTSEEAAALVGINAYLGVTPFATKGLRTAPGKGLIKGVTTKEVPFAETPEGIRSQIKTQQVSKVPKELEPPAQEARKYKSAEEFFRAGENNFEIQKMRRVMNRNDRRLTPDDFGGEEKITLWRTSNKPISAGDYVYITKEEAKRALKAGQGKQLFSKVVNVDEVINAGPGGEFFYGPHSWKKYDGIEDFWREANGFPIIKKLTVKKTINDLNKSAIEGLKRNMEFGKEEFLRNSITKDIVKEYNITKSQLTDFYNQATQKAIKQTPKELEPLAETKVRIERPLFTQIRKIFGRTKEQERFGEMLKEHMDKYFEGRSAVLSKEDPLNAALSKLNDVELKTYSSVTQGLINVEKPSVNLKSAVDLWRKTNHEIEADLIARKKILPEQAENRRWKPVETVTGRNREELKAMGVDPIYYPYLAEDLLKKSDFIATTGKRTKGGYLKRFTGKLLAEDNYIKDPRVAIPRNRLQVFRDKMNEELVNSVRDTFAERDKVIIKEYRKNPELAEKMQVEEWKPSGSLRFFRQSFEELLRSKKKLPKFEPKKIITKSTRSEELHAQVNIAQEILRDHPAKLLEQYANKRTGELPEVLGGQKTIWGKLGDDIANELGFKDSEIARESYQQYRTLRQQVKDLQNSLRAEAPEAIVDYTDKQLAEINAILRETEKIKTRPRVVVGVSKKVESYWIPKTIADELNTFTKPGKFEKIMRLTYDPLIDMWRVSVLNLVPRWFYNNLVGNIILSTLAKTDPVAFAKSAKELFGTTKIGKSFG